MYKIECLIQDTAEKLLNIESCFISVDPTYELCNGLAFFILDSHAKRSALIAGSLLLALKPILPVCVLSNEPNSSF